MFNANERETAISAQRRQFVESGLAAEREMKRTGKAYDMHDVHAYRRAKLAGKNPKKPVLKHWGV